MRSRYDENARYADHLVGRLIEIVREAGRYDDALIVLTSDHGEAFFEDGRFLHTRLLYDEFLRVPFVVKWPSHVTGFAKSIVDPVSLIDIAPTIIDGLGLTDARAKFQGTSLLPAVFEAASLPRTLYAHTRGIAPPARPAQPWFTLRDGPHKIVFGESVSTAELFDVARDAAEQNNLASTDRLRTQYLVQKLLLQRYRNLEILSASGGLRSRRWTKR